MKALRQGLVWVLLPAAQPSNDVGHYDDDDQARKSCSDRNGDDFGSLDVSRTFLSCAKREQIGHQHNFYAHKKVQEKGSWNS